MIDSPEVLLAALPIVGEYVGRLSIAVSLSTSPPSETDFLGRGEAS